MTQQEAQQEANKLQQPVWYATGDGGGWWLSPDRCIHGRKLTANGSGCGQCPPRPMSK